ncbi:MAG: hypothetical protein WKG07_00605 [Hymenobacter sp.]
MISKPCPATPPTPSCPKPTSRCGLNSAPSATPASWPRARSTAELFSHGGLYAEFGKVVCISVGFFRPLKDETLEFRTKSFADEDECTVLRGFGQFLQRYAPYGGRYAKLDTAGPEGHFLCAHNGREFDYGYLGRRMLICGQPIPPMLDVAGHKALGPPPPARHDGPLEIWRQQGPHFPTPAGGRLQHPLPQRRHRRRASGARVLGRKNLGRIVVYCEKDVITTARVYLHYTGQQELWPEVQLTQVPWVAAPATA